MSSISTVDLAKIFSYLAHPIDDIHKDIHNDIHNVIHISTKWKNAIIYTELTDEFLASLFRHIYPIYPVCPVCESACPSCPACCTDEDRANTFVSKLNDSGSKALASKINKMRL